ncbi:MAG: DUF2829 domain-containing protein [Parabacteroides sp.]|nr:DUF2829 domain-containing protein [Parabacteroides sp.]
MDFPDALKECLAGKKITNEKWNGKGMYVFMMPGYPNGVPANEALSIATGIPEGERITVLPYLMMKNATGEFGPWLISQMDVFSTGWKVIE